MGTKLRSKISLLFIAFVAMLALPAIALADVVTNNLEANTVDTVAENMPLQVGGDPGTTTLYVSAQGSSGPNPPFPDTNGNGCNLSGNTTYIELDVTSDKPAVATVSPASVRIDDCDESKGVTLTVSPVAEGTATITVKRKADTNTSAPGTFYYDTATFTVNVSPPPPPANTPPQVDVSGVLGGSSYNKGSVPTAMCDVTDTEDGNSSFAATLSPITGPYASDGIGSQTASCEYTDDGGLGPATASVIYSIVDPSPPVITKVVTPPLPNGDNDWYTGNVTVKWTVSDPESPNSLAKDGCADQSITSDQVATTYSCSATSAGGSVGPVSVTIKRDGTAPTNVAFVGAPTAGSHNFGSVPANEPTCTADGAISGLKSCVVSGYSTAVGSHTLKATATDNAGNTATKEITYTVNPYTLNGFFQPVDMGIKGNTDLGSGSNTGSEVNNIAKAGQTVPLKFKVFNGAIELTDTSVVKSLVQQITCGQLSGDPEDIIENYATGGTSLRYDTTGGQFIFNWQTPKNAGGCYKVTMTTKDNSFITAYFTLRK